MTDEAIDARSDLFASMTRYSDATLADDSDAHYFDHVEYCADELALAARRLVEAVDALPVDRQPAGWVRVFCDTCGKPDGPAPAGRESRTHGCAACVARYEAANPFADEPPF